MLLGIGLSVPQTLNNNNIGTKKDAHGRNRQFLEERHEQHQQKRRFHAAN
jgi:hypothetical protein